MTTATFVNEQATDWELANNKRILERELARVREQFAANYPLFINDEQIYTANKLASLNPSNHQEVIGYMSQASKRDIDKAIVTAKSSYKTWKGKTFRQRADYLIRAADLLRQHKVEFMAWLMYESGKIAIEAEGEVNEAIDFLEMYARNAMTLDKGAELIPMDNVENQMVYHPLGIGVIIPPWNFPLAILAGLTVSAIVTGNTVLVKPSSAAPIVGAKFMEMMQEAGLPDGVINFVPGSSREIGDYMISHKDVNFISFTGSQETGLYIDELAHRRIPEQKWIKRVVAEMGGKGGIVVDETADLDAAAEGIVVSAFGYQGQKCSAGSRAIIHEAVYDDLIEKIVERTKKLSLGSVVENHSMGPVIDEKAFKSITNYIEIGKKEATLAFGGNSNREKGYFIEPTIFTDAGYQSTIMQEEIFGPVLAISKVASFEEGIDVYNDTKYGLTGAFYTGNKQRMAYAKQNMECGNLFLNGKCTGAVVGVQPFGGYYLSGTGSKTGTVDFLMNFVLPKTISENL